MLKCAVASEDAVIVSVFFRVAIRRKGARAKVGGLLIQRPHGAIGRTHPIFHHFFSALIAVVRFATDILGDRCRALASGERVVGLPGPCVDRPRTNTLALRGVRKHDVCGPAPCLVRSGFDPRSADVDGPRSVLLYVLRDGPFDRLAGHEDRFMRGLEGSTPPLPLFRVVGDRGSCDLSLRACRLANCLAHIERLGKTATI